MLDAGALDGADMDEHVLAAVIRLDEAEALGAVEPLHCSRSHGSYLSQTSVLPAKVRPAVEFAYFRDQVSKAGRQLQAARPSHQSVYRRRLYGLFTRRLQAARAGRWPCD